MIQRVVDIVKRASALMVTEGFDIKEKDGCTNIVTSSDVAVQEFLCRELARLLPDSGFICEEEDVHQANRQYVWIIDPIDGTTNYARGTEFCCISVALKKDNDIVLGVVYSPGRNQLFTAEKGRGAFCNGKPIHVSLRPFSDALFFTALSQYRKEYANVCSAIIMETYHSCNDVRRVGSAALELCLIATGAYEMFFEMRLQPWDYAAGMLVLQEAGGCICSHDGNLPGFDAPHLICAANTTANLDRLLSIIRRHLPEVPYKD